MKCHNLLMPIRGHMAILLAEVAAVAFAAGGALAGCGALKKRMLARKVLRGISIAWPRALLARGGAMW
jgi:hypothetical protein